MKVIAIALSAAVLCTPAYAQWVQCNSTGPTTCSSSPVGVNTTTPTTKLQTAGTLNGGGIISWLGGVNAFVGTSNSSVFGSTGTAYLASTAQLAFCAGQAGGVTADPSSTAILIDNNGNVGIGTTGPAERLHAKTQAGPVGIRAESGDVPGANAMMAIDLLKGPYLSSHTSTNGTSTANYGAHRMTFGANSLVISYSPATAVGTTRTWTDQFTLDSSGNATVSGDLTANHVINATYQDVAEWVPADAALAPGTVVVLDRGAVNHVTASRHAYDTGVAGVVSANPGVLLGQAGKDKARIATTGRVRVKVDAAKGAVGIGDLLVTSDRAGYAMKSQPVEISGRSFHQPGTVLGKALEPLPNGEGEILVLLSLQ